MHLKIAFGCLVFWISSMAAAVEINTANEAELDSVKGLGPSGTARIMQAREQAPFQDWADLMKRVKGIKQATAQRLSNNGLTINGLSINGLAYPESSSSSSSSSSNGTGAGDATGNATPAPKRTRTSTAAQPPASETSSTPSPSTPSPSP